jgi:K+-transporting ATPase c subunit
LRSQGEDVTVGLIRRVRDGVQERLRTEPPDASVLKAYVLVPAVASGIDPILRVTTAAISMNVMEFGEVARQVRAESVKRFVSDLKERQQARERSDGGCVPRP